jgi:uncharacterized membrane protein
MTRNHKPEKRRSGPNRKDRLGVDLQSGADSNEKIIDIIENLESRISHIEFHLGIHQEGPQDIPSSSVSSEAAEESDDALETQVGENWFAKVGIVVLALGVIFLLTFPYQSLPSYAPSVIGYLLVSGIVGLSRYWRDSFPQVSRYLLGGGLLLLYFTTLRLSHFGPAPALSDTALELVLLLSVVALILFISIAQRSPYLVGLSLVLGFLTSLDGGPPPFVFSVILVMSIVATILAIRYQWYWILILGIVLSSTTHFLWSMNDPLLGNPLQQVSSPEANLLFVLLYAVPFGLGTLLHSNANKEDSISVTSSVLNGFGSYVLLTFLTLTSFKSSFAAWHLAASGTYLVFATLFWIRAQSKLSTFVYAMLGYVALSAAIVDTFAPPDVFVWLCWQSILVISTAVWFRSRFIVVANFIIYLIVLAAYLSLAGAVGTISISFGIVALVSARILNWRKDRLELKTEMMRNAYLTCALFVLPYALYHVVPNGYVSISWLGLALFYYVSSRLLNNNRKYRWMALLTTLLTVLYVFTVELVGLNPTIRITSFLLLGIALLTISMIYSRKRRPK